MSLLVDKALDFAKACHAQDCSGHDIEHILRVYTNANQILTEEPTADVEVVQLAAILHDVDDYKLGENTHKVETFLQSVGVDVGLMQRVLRVIEAIGFSKSGSKPHFDMIEQKILSDADKLDAMGAIGVCRAVMYSAATGRELFDAKSFPQENLTKEEYQNKNRQGNHTINHFFDKLLKLKGAMQTDYGKKEAQKRFEFMVLFLEEFFSEMAVDEWQKYLKQYLNQLNL